MCRDCLSTTVALNPHVGAGCKLLCQLLSLRSVLFRDDVHHKFFLQLANHLPGLVNFKLNRSLEDAMRPFVLVTNQDAGLLGLVVVS